MADLQSKNKSNSALAQESINVSSVKDEKDKVVCLDRVDHISKLPVIGTYDKKNNTVTNNGVPDYKISTDAPYDIRDISFPVQVNGFTRNEVEPTYKKIVLIDSTVEDIRNGAYASHYKMVEAVIKQNNQFLVKGFDMGIPGNSQLVNYDKYLKVLSHLDDNYEWGPIKVLNLSFVKEISFKMLNSLVKEHGKMSHDIEITPENVSEHSESISYAIVEASYSNDPKAGDYKNLIKEIDILNSLMEKGVSIVISAGNSGRDMIDLRGAILPDLIMVGGKAGNLPDYRSANNSTIDTWEDFSRSYNIKGIDVTLEGTSFSAPVISKQVADMQGYSLSREIPLSIKKINDILRSEKKVK